MTSLTPLRQAMQNYDSAKLDAAKANVGLKSLYDASREQWELASSRVRTSRTQLESARMALEQAFEVATGVTLLEFNRCLTEHPSSRRP